MVSGDKAGAGLDRGFAGLARFAGIGILIILAFVAFFLVYNSWGAIYHDQDGQADTASFHIGEFLSHAWPLVIGTVIVSVIALLIAAPIAIGVALYISHYAPPRASRTIGYIIDLLAAIPSVVYGAWGMTFLAPTLVPFYGWLNEYLGFIPIFGGAPSPTGRTVITAGVVLSVMVLPIITSVCREIFIQTPKLHEEAALALGATRWEMIKMTVLPFARGGIISGIMLGLGRALGETMAVVLVLSSGPIAWSIIQSGRHDTIPSNIASNFPESRQGSVHWHELIAIGLVLFIITLLVNMIARWIVARHKEFSGAN
ncbi:phosphate ABC transporter permease subunit PstC [Nesterenkonia flava]|uniref:Phosphate transport system permease protein n=1 Tax=Nesterenkonia flava TaxID=469799 RepID=A0ABU1FU68_9MICC|nr:phosphate ABC transporter permease subunit PstC [Nesterenkonia flava]MDR5712212.1 phosphate ABC transporter permease subunit PstC [Nesterenkonia flava]